MTPAEAAATLRQFNEWRRGDEDIPQPDPREISEAIDAAAEMIERTNKLEKALAGMLKEFNEGTISDMVHDEWMACVNARAALEEPK
jgi:hypothetical protein